jgi:hypothetical protein
LENGIALKMRDLGRALHRFAATSSTNRIIIIISKVFEGSSMHTFV